MRNTAEPPGHTSISVRYHQPKKMESKTGPPTVLGEWILISTPISQRASCSQDNHYVNEYPSEPCSPCAWTSARSRPSGYILVRPNLWPLGTPLHPLCTHPTISSSFSVLRPFASPFYTPSEPLFYGLIPPRSLRHGIASPSDGLSQGGKRGSVPQLPDRILSHGTRWCYLLPLSENSTKPDYRPGRYQGTFLISIYSRSRYPK